MSEKPLVSVIIPCYNGEAFINEALESVLSQTWQDFDLIAVDDGSVDSSPEIIGMYLSDDRVRLIQHETNRGIPQSRNTGIRGSEGEFLAFLDQDDIWLPDKLKEQLEIMLKNPTVGLVCSGMLRCDLQGRFLGSDNLNAFRCSKPALVKEMFLYPINSASAMLIRRQVLNEIGLFNETLVGWDDFEMWMRLAAHCDVAYTERPLVVKRVHMGSTNVLRREILFDEALAVAYKVCDYFPDLQLDYSSRVAKIYTQRAISAFISREYGKARQYVLQSLGTRLFQPKVYVFATLLLLGSTGLAAYQLAMSILAAARHARQIHELDFLCMQDWEVICRGLRRQVPSFGQSSPPLPRLAVRDSSGKGHSTARKG